VPFSPPAIGPDEIEGVVAALNSGWLSSGPRVRDFESRFADYVGARHAIAVNSGTAALHLSLVAAGVGPGDEVVTTPLTFCATANAVIHTGATPVFADVDRATMNIDPSAVAAALTPRTRALLPVHFAGRPADTLALATLASRQGLVLIEDAAHAVETVSNAGKTGSAADFSCFSFYATKNLTTGEGGMVTTHSDRWAERMRIASLHGMSRNAWTRYHGAGTPHYDVVMAGFKYNMMDVQAAIGLCQLARLGELHARRVAIWRAYDEAFLALPLTRPSAPEPGTVHARHLYTVLVDERACGLSRDRLAIMLHERGVATSVHFRALHLHPYYAERFNLARGMFPNSEFVSDRTLSLPLSAAMSDGDVERVVDAVLGACR
jgi:dTDP-4-amino-4,6-dideoxygalactose transaminase